MKSSDVFVEGSRRLLATIHNQGISEPKNSNIWCGLEDQHVRALCPAFSDNQCHSIIT